VRGSAPILVVTVGLLLVAAVFLRGLEGGEAADPTVSIDNGAPAGTLALWRWLPQRGVDVEAWRDHRAPIGEGRALLVVPPPQVSRWRGEEADAVLARVEAGGLDVVLLCDEDRRRRRALEAWWTRLGVRCVAPDAATSRRARGTLPAFDAALFFRSATRVAPGDKHHAVPAWVDEDDHVVALRVAVGEGRVTVLSTSTLLSNDGIARADNARMFLGLIPEGGKVIFAEAHHNMRGADAIERAFSRTGPNVALAALVLLVPLVLLGFAPRRGDPPLGERRPPFLAARRSAEALAALYVRAGVQELPASESGLDSRSARDGRSAA
jgi:hypothetical protein